MFNILFGSVLEIVLISTVAVIPTNHGKSVDKLEIVTIMEQPLITPSPNIVATVLELTFPPGDPGVLPHHHSGPVVGYVVDGEFLFQVKGESPRVIRAGGTFHETDGQVHVWTANASNNTLCKVVATIYGRPGVEILTWDPDYIRKENREETLAMIL